MSTFIATARAFADDPGTLSKKEEKYRGQMIETVHYLLANAIGLKNAVSTNSIISHLQNHGFNTYRKDWQINVLGALRKRGIFIASKRAKGMYLIDSESDVKAAILSIQSRVDEETARLNALKKMARDAGFNID